jgi:hypothetical protein
MLLFIVWTCFAAATGVSTGYGSKSPKLSMSTDTGPAGLFTYFIQVL